jgi:hypothetical protein
MYFLVLCNIDKQVSPDYLNFTLSANPAVWPDFVTAVAYCAVSHVSLGPVYEFVCISFRTDNLNCFGAS